MRRPVLLTLLALMAMFAAAPSALADGRVASDPPANIAPPAPPPACNLPDSAGCIDAGLAFLDAARAQLGQPPYQVPQGFDSLPADQQVLILTDLDRVLAGLAPVRGVLASLDAAANQGAIADNDPEGPPNLSWTANWDGGDPNIVYAYGEWMYNDGPGSGNLDCARAGEPGCWGHRHDILAQFDGSGLLELGAAAGADSSGWPSFAMLIVQDADGAQPAYTYTWSQALAAGAGTTTTGSEPAQPSPVRLAILALHVHRHRVSVSIQAPAPTGLRCALTGRRHGHWRRDRFVSCAASSTFSSVPAGRYRLHVRSGAQSATRYLRVR